jgi:hypothetical protein
MCSCFSTNNLVIAFILDIMACISYFSHHLLSTNHKCTQPCYFPMLLKPATQKPAKIWDSSMRSSRRANAPSRLPVELWSLSAAISSRVFDLVLRKTLFM